MRNLIFIIYCVPFIGFSQISYSTKIILDGYFDHFQEDFEILSKDSSIIITGRTDEYNGPKFILKLDKDGVLLNTVVLDTSSILSYTYQAILPEFNVIESLDSNILLLSTSLTGGTLHQRLRKLDPDLNPLWEKKITNSFASNHSFFYQLTDSSLIFDSFKDSINSLVCTNSNGEILWSNSFSHSTRFYNNNILEIDSNYFIVTYGNKTKSLIQKWGFQGNLIWNKSIDSTEILDLNIDSLGNLIYLGFSSPENKFIIFKTDSIGNFIIAKTIDEFNNYIWHPEGSIVLKDSGIYFSYSSSQMEFTSNYLKTDYSLDSLRMTRSLGKYEGMKLFNENLYVLENGGFIHNWKLVGPREFGVRPYISSCELSKNVPLVSTTFSISDEAIQIDTNMVQSTFDSSGRMNNTGYTYSDCLYVFYGSVEELEEQNRISIYPNPSTGQFTIESEEGKLIENIQIHSTDGRLIYTHENLKKSKAEMHLEHLPKGIYFLKAKIGSELVHDKIVIE